MISLVDMAWQSFSFYAPKIFLLVLHPKLCIIVSLMDQVRDTDLIYLNMNNTIAVLWKYRRPD